MTPFTQAVALAGIFVATGAATVSVMNEDIPDLAIPELAWTDTPALDGMAFAIEATLNNEQNQTDELRFTEGGFISMDCEEYCNFGLSPYQTWTEGDVIHFTATTRCPTAPHTVVWYGTVEGGEITVEMTWTTRRWYWTHQIAGTGGGSRIEQETPSG